MSMDVKRQVSRGWTFTLFDIPSFREEKLKSVATLEYLVWQKEMCPKTQRPHFQGYVYFTNPRTLGGVRRLIGGRPHLEKARGTPEQNKQYCTKEDTRMDGPWEHGTIPKQGRRADVNLVHDLVVEGKDDLAIADQHPAGYYKYYRAVKRVRFLRDQEATKDFRKVQVHVFLGPPGCGKTRYCTEHYKESLFILRAPNDKSVWFDGYRGQTTLLIDDFYGWIRWGTLLHLLDGYQTRIPIKGDFTWAKWNTVLITSNVKTVRDWYSTIDENLFPALERRITKIHRLGLAPRFQRPSMPQQVLPRMVSPTEWSNTPITVPTLEQLNDLQSRLLEWIKYHRERQDQKEKTQTKEIDDKMESECMVVHI